MKIVSVVILNFNGEQETRKCLDSIKKLDNKGYALDVIVVDNGSAKKFSIFNFQFSIGEFKIIRNEENLGFAGGNNVGIQHALKNESDYVLILNNDTIVDKNLISELLSVADSDDRVGIVVPKIYIAKGYEFHKDRYSEGEKGRVIWYAGGRIDWNNVMGVHEGVDEVDRGQFESTKETEFATGCCMLIKKEVFENVGFFDPQYFLYYEDSDLSQRVKKRGYKIMFVPKAKLWHKNAASAGGSGSSLQDYYITRNRLLFGMRYAPLSSKIALIKESLRLLARGRAWQKKGVVDFYLQRLGKGSYRDF